jgi:cytochrome P450
MRTVEPIHHNPVGFWILTRYDDCLSVLQDPRWSHDADRILEPARGDIDPVDATVRLLRASVAFADAPDHARHRRPLEAAMKSAMRGVKPRVTKVAADLLRLMHDREGGADLVRDYAAPLSIVVMCDVLGLPSADRPVLLRLSHDLSAGIDPNIGNAGVIRAGAAAAALTEYMLDCLDAQRGATAAGVLVDITARMQKFRTWELIADLIVVLVTGVETCRHLIANSALALLRNPDQLRALRDQPLLIDSGLDELIRYDGPLHLTARVANEDVDVAGTRIAAGEQALVLLAAANRDPARFTNPDRLDLARTENPHLGFGAGSHACFAAPLARLIGSAAITALVGGLKEPELAGEVSWGETVTMRGPGKLPIRFER